MSKKIIKAKLRERMQGPVNEKILNYVAADFNSVAYMNADKLCYVTECTMDELNAFFAALGVGNMLEFKNLLRDIAYSETDGPDGVMENSLQGIADMVMRYEMANITEFSTTLDMELVSQLAQDLLSASEVYLVGMRASPQFTSYAAHILSRVGIKTRIVDATEQYMETLGAMDRSGLVLTFCFSRYHKGTVALLNMLKKNGYRMVAVTDYPMSPPAQLADYSICVPRHSHDYTVSHVAGNMLLNILAIHIGMQDKRGLINTLRQHDEITQSLEYFF